MQHKKMLIVGVLAATVMAIAVPALAQSTTQAPTAEQVRPERSFPPAWIAISLEDLQAKAHERAAQIEERVTASERLSDDQKTDILANVDGLLAAVDGADTNAEVVGTTISRTQLQRREFRAEKRGETFNVEAHVAGDVDRATLRLERLTKVAGWAGAAGEDVAAINGYLGEASTQLDLATGTGSVEQRRDAVHIALAWMTEAAAALDSL